MSDTPLGAGDTDVNKTDKNPCLHRSYILVGEIETNWSKICQIVMVNEKR